MNGAVGEIIPLATDLPDFDSTFSPLRSSVNSSFLERVHLPNYFSILGTCSPDRNTLENTFLPVPLAFHGVSSAG